MPAKYKVEIHRNDKCSPDRSSEGGTSPNKEISLNLFSSLAGKYQCTTKDTRTDQTWDRRWYGTKYSVTFTTLKE